MSAQGKIKVIEFISSLHHGGAETLVKDYACLIDKEKFDVIVMTTRGRCDSYNEKALDENGIKTYYAENPYAKKNKILKAIGVLKRYQSIIKIIEAEKPDVIHCHLGTIKFIADIAKFKKLNCKLVFTVHSDLERQLAMKGIRKSVNYLLKKHDLKIIALHKAMREELVEKYGDRGFIVLNNGTYLSKYDLPESVRTEYRAQLGIPEDAFVLGHIGRFIPLKNHRFLLNIFCELLKMRENSRLVLIGDGELRQEIEEKTHELGISDKVVFTGLRGDIPQLLKCMDAFCLPSTTEGVPVTVVEAQAAGLKCAISDIVVDDVVLTSRVTKVSLDASPEIWAKILLDDNTQAEQKNALDSFNIVSVVKKLSDYYEEILNG